MSGTAYRTPDVLERQSLVDFFSDSAGFNWHHRLLLQPIGPPGMWVALSPDLEVGTILLTDHRVIVLGPGAALPPARTSDSYFFDSELDADTLQDARELAAVLGGSVDASGGDASVWRVSDPAHEAFADAVPNEVVSLPDHFVSRGRAGLANISDEWVTCQLADPAELEEWRVSKVAPRLLPDARVLRGKARVRLLPFADAVRAFARRDLAGWPCRGPVAAQESGPRKRGV